MCLSKKTILIFLCLSMLFPLFSGNKYAQTLHGQWKLFLDSTNLLNLQYKPDVFNDYINLPTTLDEAQKGRKSSPSNATNHMLRKYAYYGKAWYEREVIIPKEWKGKFVELLIERTRPSHIFVDGKLCGSSLRISVPQCFDLSHVLTPGKHRITVLVDNGPDCGLPREIASSHMWSDDTQTNWNGLLGKIELLSKPLIHIQSVKTIPVVTKNQAIVNIDVLNAGTSKQLIVVQLSTNKSSLLKKVELLPGHNQLQFELTLDASCWDEYNPVLQQIGVNLLQKNKRIDSEIVHIGLRNFAVQARAFSVNSKPVFLRGRHDACVFPLTGYAPMTVKEWNVYFDVVKRYGFNHVRFHSWCPPEAAFIAADSAGVYLQPELPYWGLIENSPESKSTQFLIAEGKAILDAYANHPSFVMFSSGNELWGEIQGMQYITKTLREHDNRPLFALGTNYHLGWQGPQQGEDYLVSCRVGGHNDTQFEPHVRSSFSFADAVDGGILNATYPNTKMDFANGVNSTSKPVISHETGQFQMYPDANDLKNYTGILRPQNYEIFIDRIKSKFGEANYQSQFEATAALSLICYKADLEMMRRTEGLAGFQMLDLQDFPGQGTAVVGILNATMNPKGIISEEEFHSWNNDVLPLWLSNSFSYYGGDLIKSTIKISNNSHQSFQDIPLNWKLTKEDHTVLAAGEITLSIAESALSNAIPLNIQLPMVNKAIACKLELKFGQYTNKYPVWIYPNSNTKLQLNANVRIFTQCNNDLITFLEAGGKAILMPNMGTYPLQTVGGLFTSDYWNYSMFKSISENAKKPVSPGTMGLLINKKHPVFEHFPTTNHSDWQWWPIVKNSNPLILDGFENKIHPIVQTIDNVERVHFLSTLFECKVAQGKLFVCMADLKNTVNYKENKQLHNAIIQYVNSTQFEPVESLSAGELKQLFSEKSINKSIQGVKNVSYE